ncbi:MAG TPA: hypothetical protein VKU01_14290 [Bryobacteraceae bacterium]|nr:hypothetical protein [Bryobacteraceae bacterium]
MPARWCTVTLVHENGRRYSIDVEAVSSFDAAHLYVCHVREHPDEGLPIPHPGSLFEVVADGHVYRVEGARLKRWIEKQRSALHGPKGYLFRKRPEL